MRTRILRGEGIHLGAALLLTALWVFGSAAEAVAQTAYFPYYGKNQIRYDNFEWHIYETDHFEIFYYPETEQHLERVAGYAESAYQQISADLKHDLAFKVPMVLFKTSSEFQQQNVIPGAAQEGVGAFAESTRYRMVLPMDEPSDLLYRLIVHELTHIFEFDIIPQSLIRRSVPLWVNEGLSDYMTGYWRPIDLMTVRDAAIADIVPKMSEMHGYGTTGNPRMVYNLGHAVFEFIESRWGKEGIRQFLFALRKSVIGGGEDAYEEALRLTPEEFDQQFEKYLKDRFKPFRDKERPADYGRDLAPNPEKSRFVNVYSIEASPSGDLIAGVTANRRDGELDIVLLSAKDGSIIRNLTTGFDKDRGFEYISYPGGRANVVPWMAWSPDGDQVAYFARTEKRKSLILQNVVTGKTNYRVTMEVDDPESPTIHPNGRLVAFSALRGAVGDIYMVDLETEEVTNLTDDAFADYGPTFSPDGKFLVYVARISGNEKLFRLDLETRQKTQLTFGTHDDSTAKFLDADTLVFSSTALSPTEPVEPEVARNGNIYNIWTLSLKTGELRQYTDAVGGNLSPVPLRTGESDVPKIAFVSYYKGDYALHTLDRKDPLQTASTEDYGAPGLVTDFQAPMTHTLVTENKRKKGAFEKLFLDGRPPINVGVTSGGDIFGGTQVSFSDVLGDKQISMYAASISQYRTLAVSYMNLSRRFQYALQGYSQTVFFYGQLDGLFYDPTFRGFIDRDLAIATRTVQGGTAFGIWPFNRYRRMEVYGGMLHYDEHYRDPALEDEARRFQEEGGLSFFRRGTSVPLGIAFVQETTVFREFGPLAGNTMRLAYEIAPKMGNTLSRQTLDGDVRYYQRLGGSGLLALRARGFRSWGDAPDFTFFGGNSEMRGYEYLEFIGHNAFFGNAELRFPLIEAMLTPIGVLGGIRGVAFFNIGSASFNVGGQTVNRNGEPYKFASSSPEVLTPFLGWDVDLENRQLIPILGDPIPVEGFRLVDGRASYGVGLETFALGFPIHFDWSWKTTFNRAWEDYLFADRGGSGAFRDVKFSVWIGYDF